MAKTALTVPEAAVRLEANGRRLAVWTCSPDRLDALAAGWLLAGGYIVAAADIGDLRVEQDGDGAYTIRAAVPRARFELAEAERAHRVEVGCGLMHPVICDPDALARGATAPEPPPMARFADLFRRLYGEDSAGGTHAAALSDGAGLRHRVEEIGRHNAVDKAIGSALLGGEAIGAHGLVVSARISGEMAWKAARAGIAWVASRSIPTTLAVRIADAAGMPLVARAAGPTAHVFRPTAARVGR